MELPCDILVPAALENQITGQNAPRLRTKLIVEGANGPLTPEADVILASRGITSSRTFLPTPGVTVSYFSGSRTCRLCTFGTKPRLTFASSSS